MLEGQQPQPVAPWQQQPQPASPWQQPPAAGPSLSSDRMATALTAADLQAHGLEPELEQTAVGVEDEGDGVGVYCGWTRASGAQGGIELDLWSVGDPATTFATILANQTGEMRPAGLAGADQSMIGLSVRSGFGPFATIAVARGGLVFTLAIPTGQHASDQLMGLASVVLERLS